jgi:hypothetical protein
VSEISFKKQPEGSNHSIEEESSISEPKQPLEILPVFKFDNITMMLAETTKQLDATKQMLIEKQ